VAEPIEFTTLGFTQECLEHLVGERFSASDLRRIFQALRMLDTNERHPSLRVHQLQGQLEGRWSASASDELRITFRRIGEGRKALLDCTRHYQ
jgi:mRNA-degrading endonuclease YafQ of YafQ-DinJ toxin-antitoxin module